MKSTALVVDNHDMECIMDLIEEELMSAYNHFDSKHLSDLYDRVSLVYERTNCN